MPSPALPQSGLASLPNRTTTPRRSTTDTDMPHMPSSGEAKTAPTDLRTKKTKSRNGCGRCKLKRLKCDETAPSCLQCKKRNVPCPGYERTLKWSTKYEVLQPVRFEQEYVGSDVTVTAPTVNEITLPPDVVSGFEALAAVLESKISVESSVREEIGDLPDTLARNTSPSGEDAFPSSEEEQEEKGETTSAYIADINDPEAPPVFVGPFESFDADFNLESFEHQDFTEPYMTDDHGFDIEEVPRSHQSQCSSELTSAKPSRSLLLDYYRVPGPLSGFCSEDIESILVQHYFKDVCVLFSSFDSLLNPFRTTISKIFQSSSSIYYAIQSMAAAHLANTFPNMTAVGIQMQHKAFNSLQAELPLVQSGQMSGTISFLSIILLGMTTSWHESSALGEEYLATARSLILPKLLCSSEREEVQRETQFFEESLIYWEMLMGFVSQDSMGSCPGSVVRSRTTPQGPAPAARNKNGEVVPHPWTGIAPKIQILFAEVGRLVRKERTLNVSGMTDHRRSQENLLNAATLEEDLLAAEYPMLEELADPGDERTAKRDFVVIAEAYRCAGLLELYRVFPSILRRRLSTDRFTWTDKVEFEFPKPRFDTSYEDTDTKLWINSLSLHILDALKSLPSSSGTCCLQPLLLIVAGAELKLVSSLDYFDLYANDTRVLKAREFADRRLHEYAVRLPAKPQRKVIELLHEVWRRLDAGQDAFWIDVMVENGWNTVMG